MREIKFRVWETKIVADKIKPFMDYRPENLYSVEALLKHPHLMQYTGLKDKNGKEIYEGDIIQVTNKNYNDPLARCVILYKVCYSDNHTNERVKAGFWTKILVIKEQTGSYKNMGSRNVQNEQDWYLCEIVGNIYENPELLEKDNDN